MNLRNNSQETIPIKLLILGSVALVAVHLLIAWPIVGPLVSQDEAGYLGNARWIAGSSIVPEMGLAPTYAWGYSLLLAPITYLVQDPALLYRLVQLINALLLASLFPLLWFLLVQVGNVQPSLALLPAITASTYPSLLVQSSTAWSENVLAPLTVLLAISTWWLLQDSLVWQRFTIAPVALFLYAAHPRYLPILALVSIYLIGLALLKRIPYYVLAGNLCFLLPGLASIRLVSNSLIEARWQTWHYGENPSARILSRITDLAYWPRILSNSLGQAWYLAVSSLGFVVLGGICIGWWLFFRERTSERHADVQGGRNSIWADSSRLSVLLIISYAAAIFISSVVFFSGGVPRIDHRIYGRYNESFVPMWIAVGALSLMWTRPRRRFVRLIGSASLIVFFFGVLYWSRSVGLFPGSVVWNNILALYPLASIANFHNVIPWATLIAGSSVVAFGLLAIRWPRFAVGFVTIIFLALGHYASKPLVDFSNSRYRDWVGSAQLHLIAKKLGVATVGVSFPFDSADNNTDLPALVATHIYPFWLPDLRFVLERDQPTSRPLPTLWLSRVGQPPLNEPDAALVGLDGRNNLATWVLPGEALSLLEDTGHVLPSDFPSQLPSYALANSIDVGTPVGPNSVFRLRSGESIEIELNITHLGNSYFWPGDPTWSDAGVVRLGQRWYNSDGLLHDSSRVNIPPAVYPGDSFRLPVTLAAIDSHGSNLRPGRYQVGFALLQEGFVWFNSAGEENLSVTVIVEDESN